MKVYFSTSISQMTDQTKSSSMRILAFLKEKEIEVISADFIKIFTKYGKQWGQSEEQALVAQKNLTKLRKLADVVIFEVTRPSIGIGQEISIALSLNKPIIALYREGATPHILRDQAGDLLILNSYNENNLEDVLKDSLNFAESHQDVRFNFFISPLICRYLDWISLNKKIPRSVYLRNLIEADMLSNSEYNVKRR